jgi:hypothetical protein
MRRERSGWLARLWAALGAFLRALFGSPHPGPHDPDPHQPEPHHPGGGTPPPLVPHKPGETAPDVVVSAADSHARLQRAFATAVAGTGGTTDDLPDIVWVDGDNELLVRPSKMRVVFRTGFALVGITVYTQQTGDVEVVVPFALGTPDQPLGLIAATETTPRGPAAIVDAWGDPLIAAAWDALLRVARDTAAAAGVDDAHQPLAPIALAADRHGLTVTPQARHAFDRTPS